MTRQRAALANVGKSEVRFRGHGAGRSAPPHPEPIYYCATGAEMPAFEPRKEMKGQRDI
jgi:hypothetical protein